MIFAFFITFSNILSVAQVCTGGINMDNKIISTKFAEKTISMQIVSDTEIVIPDDKCDIKEIIYESTKPVITYTNVMDERVSFKICVKERVVYISKDRDCPVMAVYNETAAEDIINIDGVEKEDCVNVGVVLDKAEYRKINERKIAARVVMTVKADVFKLNEKSVVSPEEEDGIKLLKETKEAFNHTANDKNEIDIHGTFSIPLSKAEAENILAEFYSVKDLEVRALDGGYRLNGIAEISIIYCNSENTYDSMNFELPFDEMIDNDNMTSDMILLGNVFVSDLDVGVYQDDKGEMRAVDIDARLGINIDAYKTESLTFAIDGYSIKNSVSNTFEKITIPETVGSCKGKFNVKTSSQKLTNIPVLKVLSADGIINDYEVYAYEDMVCVDGVAEADVIFVAEDDNKPVCVKTVYTPFHHEIDMPGAKSGDKILSVCRVEGVSVNMLNYDETEAALSIIADVICIRENKCNALSDISESEAENTKMPSAVIYTMKKEDTLWDIAKKYRVEREDILSLNEIKNENEFKDKKRVLVMRKA